MNQNDVEALLRHDTAQRESAERISKAHGRIGIFLEDAVAQRLLEGLSLQLGLQPEVFDPATLAMPLIAGFEVLVTDEDRAAEARRLLSELHSGSEGEIPALVAVRSRKTPDEPSPAPVADLPYEGLLTLPEQPPLLTAQLGVILYAHRAFVRRYRDAMEELQLNRGIFRSVTSGITVAQATEDLPLVYVNPAFEVITGYSIEDSLGKNCRFLQGDQREQPGLTLIREALQQAREVKAVVRNYRKDGSPFWNELAVSPIRNHEGKLTHFVGIQQDVTSRVEFEEALRESEKLATAGRLAASIAHEINNPLEAVTNLIYLARMASSVDEAEPHLTMADAELRRVALLTSQSLRFYKQSTAPQAVKPSELLDAVLDIYARRLEELHISVEKRERMCDSIVCYESELRQVLSNLVRNAMDSMTPGGGRLLARTQESVDARGQHKGVLITVADTGTGMTREVQSRIFDAFYSTKGNNGTGLGLWITQEIVDRHRGRMRVKSCSIPGRSGTVFSLFLPYQGLVP